MNKKIVAVSICILLAISIVGCSFDVPWSRNVPYSQDSVVDSE